MWGRRAGVLSGQRVGKVGIQEQMAPLPLQKKPALAQPPKPEFPIIQVGGCEIFQERLVPQYRINQRFVDIQGLSCDGLYESVAADMTYQSGKRSAVKHSH